MRPQDQIYSVKQLGNDIDAFKQKSASGAPRTRSGAEHISRVGVEFTACVLIATGIGILADWWYGMTPLFCIIGLLAGIFSGMTAISRVSKMMAAENDKSNNEN